MAAVPITASAPTTRRRWRCRRSTENLRVRPRPDVGAVRRAGPPKVLTAAGKTRRRIEPRDVRLLGDLPNRKQRRERVVVGYFDPVNERSNRPLSRRVHETERRRSVVEKDVVDRVL